MGERAFEIETHNAQQWQVGLNRRFDATVISQREDRGGFLRCAPFGHGLWMVLGAHAQDVTFSPQDNVWTSMVSVLFQIEGHCVFTHAGQTHELTPGDMMLIDGAQGAKMHFEHRYTQCALLLPRQLVRGHGFGHMLDPQHPVDGALAAQFKHLAQHHEGFDVSTSHVMSTAVLSLLNGSSWSAQQSMSIRVKRAKAYIREHFADPQLCARQVASAQGISRRLLDTLMSDVGTTTSALIWSIRVEEAASMLLASPHLNISAVAMACGFRDGSHFSRRFREQMAQSPSAWRLARSNQSMVPSQT